MRRFLVRSLAVVVFLGQLSPVAGALMCDRAHAQASADCQGEDMASPAFVAERPAPADMSCAVMAACVAPAPALVAGGVSQVAAPPADGRGDGATVRPPSFTPLPVPPPPQV